jgi:ribonuclease P protein component
MIPSSCRLRTNEVEEVLKRGRGLPSGTYLSAKIFHPEGKSSATIRSAVVVSKKVAKTAVVRNRVRRAVYDSIRAASYELQAASNASVRIVFLFDLFLKVIFESLL